MALDVLDDMYSPGTGDALTRGRRASVPCTTEIAFERNKNTTTGLVPRRNPSGPRWGRTGEFFAPNHFRRIC